MAFSVTQYKTAGYRCHLVTTCFVPLEIPAIDWLVQLEIPHLIDSFNLKSPHLIGLFN